jgi:hypothetical protein
VFLSTSAGVIVARQNVLEFVVVPNARPCQVGFFVGLKVGWMFNVTAGLAFE